MYNRKTWHEKLYECKDHPKVEKIPPKMEAKFGKGTLVFPAPIEVDQLMK